MSKSVDDYSYVAVYFIDYADLSPESLDFHHSDGAPKEGYFACAECLLYTSNTPLSFTLTDFYEYGG